MARPVLSGTSPIKLLYGLAHRAAAQFQENVTQMVGSANGADVMMYNSKKSMCQRWYHAELSQACAEQLLIRDGRDGAFLVRQSESVQGAFAICLLYQQQVHTYRVLPDENGLLSVQSVQGVEVKRFLSLQELVFAYTQEPNGLMTELLYPVGEESEGGTEQTGAKSPDWKDKLCMGLRIMSPHRGMSSGRHSKSTQEDREIPSKDNLGLCSLRPELESKCRELDREIELTWCSLKILTRVLGNVASILHPDGEQVSALDMLIHKVMAVQEILSSLESKTVQMIQRSVTAMTNSPTQHSSTSPKMSNGDPTKRQTREQVSQGHIHIEGKPRKSGPQNLSVYIGTWNMGSSSPPRSVSSWLSSRGMGNSLGVSGACVSHDLYMIGTQENPQGDREWTEFLKAALISQTEKEYKVVSAQSLGLVKLVVFIKQEYEDLISRVQTSSVRTRISNSLGNRGAVGVSFEFNGRSLGFVTCHLMSGSEKVQKRNQSIGEILRCLKLGDETLQSFQLPLRLTHIFLAGDLNYKLNMSVQDVLQYVYSGHYQVLLPMDQLNQERERKKIFFGFREEQITFPPTCRYERGSRTYDFQKSKTTGTRISAPSWSDRVLWTSYPETEIKCTSYGCSDDIVTSDHSPVFSTFEIGLECHSIRDSGCTLQFQSIEAIIKTQNRSRGYIEFKFLSLQGSSQSSVNSAYSTEGSAFLKLGWSEQDLPELTLAGQDTRSIHTGHLLLSIRPNDGGESYGDCCVSLQALNSSNEHHFQAFLSQRGEETGSLRGKVKVSSITETHQRRSPITKKMEAEKESISQVSDAGDSPIDSPALRFSRRPSRRRPATLCSVTGSYSNAEYFLFEGIPSPHTPTSPRPRSVIVSGEQQSNEHRGRWEFRMEYEQSPVTPQTNKSSRATTGSKV
ncbi:phosphatidylinositol 3,4,5-trisphosphate 5-phosphatase 2-like [Discoglossus pictus]